MKNFEINGTNYTFAINSIGGEIVLTATYTQNGESFTNWTADADSLPESAEEAAGYINELDWAVGQSDKLDSSKYGTINYDGKTYILTEQAYLENYQGETAYFAHAKDSDGNDYKVVWMTCTAWEEASAKYNKTGKDEDYDSILDDESNACIWDEPYDVIAI
jgi:hypothetical protein